MTVLQRWIKRTNEERFIDRFTQPDCLHWLYYTGSSLYKREYHLSSLGLATVNPGVLTGVKICSQEMMCSLNENKEVSVSKNSWTFEPCLSIQYAKKRQIYAVLAKNADCTCTHSTRIKFNLEPCGTYESELDFAPKHFNLVPSFPGYEIA